MTFEVASPRFATRIVEALRPGGVVVLESGAAVPDGPRLNRVLIDPDEMRAAYGALTEIAFEQSVSTSDWGLRSLPLVRLAARRDSRPKAPTPRDGEGNSRSERPTSGPSVESTRTAPAPA